MKAKTGGILRQLLAVHPELTKCEQEIRAAHELMAGCYRRNGKLLVCGNGGSAADAEHMVGELMKEFALKREIPAGDVARLKAAGVDNWEYLARRLQRALPAISLVSQTALTTACANDVGADIIFAQQLYGYAREGDVFFGISTSGNSRNVVNALAAAKAFGISSIGLTGEDGGAMKALCTVTIRVPQRQTFRVQELHLPVYHALCAMVEEEFFGE